MISLTSNARFRQRVILYSNKYGVTKASNRFRISRNAIYEWKAKYNGHWKSLIDKSHRPHHHPLEHTQEEYDLISRYWNKNKDDKIVLWQKIRDKGYRRSYKSMCRAIKRLNLSREEKQRKTYKPKPYEQMTYPGQKVQIDVKYVPVYCVAGEKKYYQYTAIDEYTRLVYREMYDEHSTYSSQDFVRKVVKFFPFKIELVQTDNGTEWTNAMLTDKPKPTLFETELKKYGIKYTRIRIATPRHNGKVERQHRTDEQRFYKKMRMYSLEDGRKQLAAYNRRSNNIVKICLDYKTPNEKYKKYLQQQSARYAYTPYGDGKAGEILYTAAGKYRFQIVRLAEFDVTGAYAEQVAKIIDNMNGNFIKERFYAIPLENLPRINSHNAKPRMPFYHSSHTGGQG